MLSGATTFDPNGSGNKIDPTTNPITRRPGPGRGRPKKNLNTDSTGTSQPGTPLNHQPQPPAGVDGGAHAQQTALAANSHLAGAGVVGGTNNLGPPIDPHMLAPAGGPVPASMHGLRMVQPNRPLHQMGMAGSGGTGTVGVGAPPAPMHAVAHHQPPSPHDDLSALGAVVDDDDDMDGRRPAKRVRMEQDHQPDGLGDAHAENLDEADEAVLALAAATSSTPNAEPFSQE